MDRGGDSNTGFLPLTEAAERLGVSRLKLREAIAKGVFPARRDNEGEWRVDLTGVQDFDRQTNRIEATLDVLMGVLFDEIETLSVELQTAAALTGRLTALAGAQNVALDKAAAMLEVATSERDRLAKVACRALDAAGEAETQTTALKSTTDRAFVLLDQATTALELARRDITAKDQQLSSQAGQMDRLFTLSEQAVAKASRGKGPGWIARVLGLSGPTKR